MRLIPILAAVLLAAPTLSATPAAAEGEFAAGSQITGWDGLNGRELATFTAEVTDVVCALTGDCPADCGGGGRQMALLREADGALVLVSKNRQPAFNGGITDLLPYCRQTIAVDGLLVGAPELTDTKFYQVFLVKPEGAEEWLPTNRWTAEWLERNPEAKGKKGPWFRHDPAIAARIAETGYLGLGLETDAAFIAENY